MDETFLILLIWDAQAKTLINRSENPCVRAAGKLAFDEPAAR
jgi:hypothetical protein